ncbi:MAG: phospho-sugar mutase [Clostridiales bacterium]|nr:phospho-sugar mutase [Clostridiales bacterium]
MRFRNSIRLLVENFKSVYKLLLYKIIISTVAIALCCAFVLPELTAIVQSPQVQTLFVDGEAFIKAVLSLNGEALSEVKDAIFGAHGSLKGAFTVISMQTSKLIFICIGCALVFFAKRFVETLGYFTTGSILDDKMNTYSETPFFSAYIANLKKSSSYSIVYVSIAFVLDVLLSAIIILMITTLPLLLSLFMSTTLVVAAQGLKMTLTGKWMPAMTTDNKTLDEALYHDNKQEKQQLSKMFATYVATAYLIMIINVAAAFCTFGSALILTVPASYVLLVCMQYVNYYTVRGKKYFITYERIATNEDYGDKEHFFDYLEKNEKTNRLKKTEGEMDYRKNYQNWLNDERLCEEGKKELQAIASDEKDIEYRFGGEMEFGTAGMRGVIGYGINMMNIYTVMRATQGLAEWIKSLGKEEMERGVVISYDTRRKSEEFAKVTAGVLAKNGIKAYLFDDVHPVPMLSYAVRYLKTIAGVMITASHNPKEYNGYKVYGEDGAQMSPEDTAKVVSYINKIEDYLSVFADTTSDLIVPVPAQLDQDYIEELSKLTLSKEAVEKCGADLKLVYTPVHGSGYVPVTAILKKLGINTTIVEAQTTKDTEFSTVKVPNPEFKETLSMGIALANEINADVVFGTDPDSDRLGVALKDDNGEFVALSGNQVGILLLDYILTRLSEDKTMPANAAVVKSFVTTGMAKALCDDYGVALYETPVGFKFIGEKIKQWEKDNKHTYIFGFEESCGYLRGTHARDKDAVVASMICAEMVCYYTYIGKTVYGRLQEIYAKYGYVLDKNVSVQYSGLNAMKEMNAVVDGLKTLSVTDFAGMKVEAVRDYSAAKRKITATGEVEELDIPKCNCVYYELEGGSFVCVRPSGTEPKLKIYYSLKAKDEAAANAKLAELQASVNELLEKAKGN